MSEKAKQGSYIFSTKYKSKFQGSTHQFFKITFFTVGEMTFSCFSQYHNLIKTNTKTNSNLYMFTVHMAQQFWQDQAVHLPKSTHFTVLSSFFDCI